MTAECPNECGFWSRPQGIGIHVKTCTAGLTLDRFIKVWKVDTSGPEGCWIWTKDKNGQGYGRIRKWNGETRAHRVAYLLANGEFDRSLVMCHKCDNPSCVNPNHLFPGTLQDNFEDMRAKGRGKVAGFVTMTFGERSVMQKRINAMSGDQVCLECDLVLDSARALNAHATLKHRDLGLKCSICPSDSPRTFKSEQARKNHIVKGHKL